MKEKFRRNMLPFLAMAAMSTLSGSSVPLVFSTVHRKYHPWDGVQLTKAERKGKTPDEIQALRKMKYEEVSSEGS